MEGKDMNNNINSNNNVKEDRYDGVAIHSQVKRIKLELEKIKQPSLEQRLIRPVLRDITRQQQQQQRSRSPLGLIADRTISVGN